MIQSFLLAWKNAFVFKGKTSRKDFWFFQLASFILFLILNIAQNLLVNLQYAFLTSDDFYLLSTIFAVISQTISIVSFFYFVGNFIVGLSISVRRLNDISKKWAWIFIQIIPILGSIYFIYLMCQPSFDSNSQE